MAGLFPNSAEALNIAILVNKRAAQDLDVGLYVNSRAPADGDLISDYTELGAVGGYAIKQLVASSWDVVAGAPSYGQYPELSWTFTASVGPIHGFFVKERTSGMLRWADQLTNPPFQGSNSGDTIFYTPKFFHKKQGE